MTRVRPATPTVAVMDQ
jgi:SRSO17 transposase